jgi:lipopolysaccharide export system permease protein
MKLLDKLVLKDLLPMFFIGVFMFAALWFAADPILLASRFLAQGASWLTVILVVILSIPQIIGFTLPMGMLISVLIGFGRLSSDSESVALFAGGIPFARIAAPAIALGLVASILGYLVNDRVASHAAQMREDLIVKVLKTTTTYDYSYEDDKHNLHLAIHAAKGLDAKTNSLRQVTLTYFGPDGTPTDVVYSPHAVWIPGTTDFQFDNPTWNRLGENLSYTHLGAFRIYDLKTNAQSIELQQRKPETMTFRELSRKIMMAKASGTAKPSDIRNDETNLWSKIATPFACLVFALVGAPLGLRPQRTSKYTGWIWSVLIIFGYYVILNVMGSVARGGHCSPILAAFTPNIIGIVMGSYLIWKQST